MATSLLNVKVKSVRPASVTLGPGVVLVAILKPDLIPEDDIAVDSVIWAKCPVTKSVATLFKAFGKKENRQFRLIQGSAVLNEAQPVSSLHTEDGLCVLEAILENELRLRLPKQKPGSDIRPLQDITYNAVNYDKTPAILEPKSRPSSVSADIPIKLEPVYDSSQPAIVKYASVPASNKDASLGTSAIELAWVDFVYERREFQAREMRGQPQQSLLHIDSSITSEWQVFRPEQRQFFIDRTKDRTFQGPMNHRAFWIYYYDEFERERSRNPRFQPHASVRTMMDFYIRKTTTWRNFNSHHQYHYHDRVLRENCALEVPVLPKESNLPPEHSLSRPVLQPDTKSTMSHSSSSSDPSVQNSVSKQLQSQANRERQQSMEPQSSRVNLGELFEGRSIEQLESGVVNGVDILRSIKKKLESENSVEAQHWLTSVSNIEKQAERTKTVIGVVGATGAGKSSIINALLDEERLVPTNCMRACTAVVTEISYNYDDDLYRAEVDFINKEDWLKELKTSFEDLFDSSGKVSRESANEDSEAGIAYAKIKAVYPLLTKEMMENTTIDQLMRHANVKDLLGSSRNIEHDDSLLFYKRLQQYVDSKEKTFSREKKTPAEKAKAREMEYWPLIRVVRLHVKAPALSTGAVIVDLPGVHDSNQARAAVAQSYLKQCTGLWIVAPITRAVDDKSAKTLLGDTFKRQLKMDGGYNSVTFICSKTDDISITEAQDSLGLDEELNPLYTRSEDLRKKSRGLKDKLESLRERKSDVRAALDSADELLETWEKLRQDLEDGKTVYPPAEAQDSKKRKRNNSESGSRKRSKNTEDSDDDFVADDASDNASSEGEEESDKKDQGEPLTEDVIDDKISELKASKKEGRRQRTALEDEIRALRADMADVAKEQDEIDAELSGKCIKGRNEYSRGAIQQDFASGIRELDQEIAEEEDAANFNPEADVRDYDAVAKSLPVFCVSSRGYQKLMGRLQKDKGLSSFQHVAETEVPALQAHCKSLTVKNREVACKRFLNNLSHILNSLRLWSSSDGSGVNLTDAQQKREAHILNSRLATLNTAFGDTARTTCSSIKDELEDHLYDRFPLASETGRKEAINIQAQWGAPVNRHDRGQGGLYWATYKATVRRDGTYSNNHFNDDLIEPVIKHVTAGWEKVFSRRLPQTLSSFANSIHQLLLVFHNETEKRAIKNGSSVAAFQMLRQQLATYRGIASDASSAMKDLIHTRQKDINREFVPVIERKMLPAYAVTTAEYGTGSYMRMKNAMREHVERVKNHMFDESVGHVQDLLQNMLDEAGDTLLTRLDQIFLAVERDYQSVIIGRTQVTQKDPRARREHLRIGSEILKIIDEVEATMYQAADSALSLKTEEDCESVGDTHKPIDAEADDFAESVSEYIKSHTRDEDDQSAESNPARPKSSPQNTNTDHAVLDVQMEASGTEDRGSHEVVESEAKQSSIDTIPQVRSPTYEQETTRTGSNKTTRSKLAFPQADWDSLLQDSDSDSDE